VTTARPSLEVAREHLRGADPVLARIIDDRPGFDPRAWMAELPALDLYGSIPPASSPSTWVTWRRAGGCSSSAARSPGKTSCA
jgi:hypothetical protein